ncbi:hypothetical protein [Micromonospora sp. NPDC050495]|uniref:hypothetical protein n=1 Tax=Micromonospora sp. NPDC050495 TaxID=3154936 RepID=UPI0033DD518D
MSLEQWAAAGVVLGVILTALTLAVMVGKPLRRLARQNDEFREDWYGSAARPGRPAVPGVPERLARLEEQRDSRDSALTQAVGALRDDVAVTLLRVEQRLDDHIRTHHGGAP